MKLTKKQNKYLKAIRKYVKRHNSFPSLRVLAVLLGNTGKSTQSTREVIQRLIDRGYLRKNKTYSITHVRDTATGRTIRVITNSPYELIEDLN